eukprot:TRINITY_DN19570_c0_g1_i1.p1 TRINITY_DN19570_c0_g1~~TRINITY_DN19570_c0_g1_i1.p1  ORF type:complete len:155 (+),score=12.92 TRINITY_DN19570_c0_g1_i1:145-609(+)
MVWVAESLGNYRWAVRLGLELCHEYNRGRGRAAGKTSRHKTQAVLEWLRDHEPNYRKLRQTPVKFRHLAMPEELKDAENSVEAYRDYYFFKRQKMPMAWPPGKTPAWWKARENGTKDSKRATDSQAVPAVVKKPKTGKRKTAPDTDVSDSDNVN